MDLIIYIVKLIGILIIIAGIILTGGSLICLFLSKTEAKRMETGDGLPGETAEEANAMRLFRTTRAEYDIESDWKHVRCSLEIVALGFILILIAALLG